MSVRDLVVIDTGIHSSITYVGEGGLNANGSSFRAAEEEEAMPV